MNHIAVGILLWIPAIFIFIVVIRAYRYSTMPTSWKVATEIGLILAVVLSVGLTIDGVAESGEHGEIAGGAFIMFMTSVGMIHVMGRWLEREDRAWREDWSRENDENDEDDEINENEAIVENEDAIMPWVEMMRQNRSVQLVRLGGFSAVIAMIVWSLFFR